MAKPPPIAPMPAPRSVDSLDPVLSDSEMATARGYVEASRAASTRRAYAGNWRRFSS